MTRKSALTKSLTPMQRQEFHNRLQEARGHWRPDPAQHPRHGAASPARQQLSCGSPKCSAESRMITIDFETRSEADLKKVGAYAYSENPSTDVLCVGWGNDVGEYNVWWPDHICPEYGTPDVEMVSTSEGGRMPKELYLAILNGELIEAHNMAFEWSIWKNILVPRYGWIMPYNHILRDTMAVAAYYALPLGLEQLSRALGYPGKDPEGSRLITKYSKLHLKTAKRDIPPEDFQKFLDYCVTGEVSDVKLEQAISDELGDLPPQEQEIWQMHFEMNQRGLFLDLAGIENASAIVEARSAELVEEFKKITGFTPNQHQKVKDWFGEQGYELDNLQADYLWDILENGICGEEDGDGIPVKGDARRAIEIRLANNKASTKKLDAMARQRGSDGRARFQTRYHGAATGRTTGTGFQPLNLNRGFGDDVSPDNLVADIAYRDGSWLDCLYDNAMDAVGKASRHWIMAEPKNKIIAGDFVSVEAVVLACVAREDWKIEIFRSGGPVYELMACKIHNLPQSEVDLAWNDKGAFKKKWPDERQDGKTGELAFGYQGALNAWLKFDSSGRHSDEAIIGFCKGWRKEHPLVVDLWRNLQTNAILAVNNPGETYTYNDIGFEIVDEWLTMILPDGKRLWYRDPQIRVGMPQWHKPRENEDCADGTCDCRPVPKLTYMAQKEGRWRRVYTYGGKLTENAIQAISRQILFPAIKRLEAAGYTPILDVYDECVCEVPKDFGTKHEFKELMAGPLPEFAANWPISVDAWAGERYKK